MRTASAFAKHRSPIKPPQIMAHTPQKNTSAELQNIEVKNFPISWKMVGGLFPLFIPNILLFFYSLNLWIHKKGSRLRSSLMINIASVSIALAFLTSSNFTKGVDHHNCSIHSFLKDWFWNIIALSIFGLCHESLAVFKLRKPFRGKDLNYIVPLLIVGTWAFGGIGVLPELYTMGLKTPDNTKICVRVLFWGNKILSLGYELAKFFGYYIVPLGIIIKDCPKVFKYKIEGSSGLIRKIKRARAGFISTLIFFVIWLQLGFINAVAKMMSISKHPSFSIETVAVADQITLALNYILVLLVPILIYISDPRRSPKVRERSENPGQNTESPIPMGLISEMERAANIPNSIEEVEEFGTPVQRWNHLPVSMELQARSRTGWQKFCNGQAFANRNNLQKVQVRKLTPPKLPPKLKLRGKLLEQIPVQVQVHVEEENDRVELEYNPKPIDLQKTFQKVRRRPQTPKIPKKFKVDKKMLQQIPVQHPVHVLPLENYYDRDRIPNLDFMDPALFLSKNPRIILTPPSPDNFPREIQLPFDHQTIQRFLEKYYPDGDDADDEEEDKGRDLLTREKLEDMKKFPYADDDEDDGKERFV